MDNNKLLRKLYSYSQDPETYQPPANKDLADLVLMVLKAVKTIEESIETKRIDVEKKYDNEAKALLDKADRQSRDLLSEVRKEVSRLISESNSVLGETKAQLEARVQQALENIRDGEDGIVTEAEIQRAASIAYELIELPDFDALISERTTANPQAIRDALELLSGEERYKVEITDVPGLKERLEALAQIQAQGGGTIGKHQVYNFIRQAIADGTISTGTGGSSTFIELTDTPSAYTDQKNKVVAVSEDADEIVFKDVVIDENGNIGIGQGLPETLISKVQIQALSRMGFLLKRTDKFDFVQYQRLAGGLWTDITAAATESYGTASGDVLDVIGDIFVIGKTNQFSSAYIDINTARTATGVLVWEYSLGGNTWATLTCTDGTNALVNDGAITFTPPTDWATDSQNGSAQLYFIRLRVESGTFTAEPTVLLVAPGDGTNMLEVYANGGDTAPSFLIDNTGGVAIGYNDSATYRLRVAGTGYIGGALTIAGVLSGVTTMTRSGSDTNTLTTTGFTHVGGTILNGPAATALLPSQNSPVVRLQGTAWDGALSRINAMDIYLNPDSEPVTNARMAFKNTTINGFADASELMNLNSDGQLSVLGRAQKNEDTFDRVFSLVNGVTWTDITLGVSTFGTPTGDVLNVVGDYVYCGRETPFNEIYFDFNTIMSAGTTRSWEYWNGTAWTALTVTDGTNNWQQDGSATFTPPVDWATTTVNLIQSLYWVRIGTVSGTFSVEPTLRLCIPNTNAITKEVLTNGEFDGTTAWTRTGDWSQITAGTYTFTYSSGVGTLRQAKEDFNTPLEPNTWYRFRYKVGVAGPSTTVAWIGEEVATGKTYFTPVVAAVDVFFKTNANPGDFVIYTTATATSNFRLDGVFLKKLEGGCIYSSGDVRVDGILRGNSADGIKIAPTTGYVGVGTLEPTERLDVDGQIRIRQGSPGAGKILTSDADGVGTWETPGSADVGSAIHGATAKTTPVDADTTALIDSADSNTLKKLSWANIKATLKTYFDTLYGNVVGPASATDNAIVRYDGTTGKLVQNSTVTIGDTGGIATTIANTSNVVGLTVTQNDTTNNPVGALITSAAVGNDKHNLVGRLTGIITSLYQGVFHGEITNASSTSGHVFYGSHAGSGGSIFRSWISKSGTSANSINILHDNADNTTTVYTSQNEGTGTSLNLDHNNDGFAVNIDKDVTNKNLGQTSLRLDHTSVVNDAGTYTKTGAALQINSGVIETSGTITDSAQVLDINQTHADATGNVVDINTTGTGNALNITTANANAITIAGVTTDKRLIAVNNTGTQTTQDALARLKQSSASTTVPVMELETDATTGGCLLLDNNGNGITVNIDHDGNSASDITGLWVNTVNAGAGHAYAAIFEAGNVGIGTTTPGNKLSVTGNIDLSGNIELGHASDTTITRSSAGVVAVEGKDLGTVSITTTTSSATPTATGDRQRNALYLTAQAANFVIQVPSGTAVRGNVALISIKCDATLRTASVHADIEDPFAKMFDEIPANGQGRVLLEYDGTDWNVLEANVTA